MKDVTYYGNKELLKLHKTAFLASRTIPPEMVLRCYDWAAADHGRNKCIIGGFSSKLEKDVLHFLKRTEAPIILVLARKLYKEIPEELKDLLAQNRLLIVSSSNTVRQSQASAFARNRYICEMADEIIFVGITEKSSLHRLKEQFREKCLDMLHRGQDTM